MDLERIAKRTMSRILRGLGYQVRITRWAPGNAAQRADVDRAVELLVEASQIASRDEATRVAVFDAAQAVGIHFLPVHFYSPVPDTSAISEKTWGLRYDDLPNLQIGLPQISALLRQLERFSEELADVPAEARSKEEYCWNNPAFCGGDASLLYAMIRQHRPRRIIEVGSGYSTLMGLRALERNGAGRYTCIEPYPSPSIQSLAAKGKLDLLTSPVQDVPLGLFASLEAGDVLFIDSTHVVKTGSDVVHEMLKIVPATKPGVLIHVHDVFFPGEMPRAWVVEKQLFWNEQYLLTAFLAFNAEFEMLIPNAAVADGALRELASKAFPYAPEVGGASFWFGRRRREQHRERPSA